MSDLELKYAPHKCKHFVCGDCAISGRTCISDYPECRAAELQTDLEHFKEIEKTRELNSFEKGIKEEVERLLNDTREDKGTHR